MEMNMIKNPKKTFKSLSGVLILANKKAAKKSKKGTEETGQKRTGKEKSRQGWKQGNKKEIL